MLVGWNIGDKDGAIIDIVVSDSNRIAIITPVATSALSTAVDWYFK